MGRGEVPDVALRQAVVLIEVEGVGTAAGDDQEADFILGRVLETADRTAGKRQDGAGADKPGVLLQLVAEGMDLPAVEKAVVGHVVPAASAG